VIIFTLAALKYKWNSLTISPFISNALIWRNSKHFELKRRLRKLNTSTVKIILTAAVLVLSVPFSIICGIALGIFPAVIYGPSVVIGITGAVWIVFTITLLSKIWKK
jgi:hypothetical protein